MSRTKSKIWVDADACPVAVKDMLFRAAERVSIELVLVANSVMRVPKSVYISTIQVGAGFDVADDKIVALMSAGDLVITADIPLAADVLAKGGFALNPRGTMFSSETIRAQLSMRNFMDELRGSGVMTGGQAAFNQSDRMTFANALDRWLTKYDR